MNRIAFVIALTGALNFAQAQNEVLLTVANEQVTKAEFESIFKKNNKNTEVTKESLDEYIELFVNFKLKVKEAESLGMDTVKKFIDELNGYRTQLARPYLVDNDLNETLLQEAYNRKKEEVKASHILINLPANPSPADTLKAYNRIMQLRARAVKGENFAELARNNSEDPSAKENGGNLGYFSALQMVYPFENMAYKTPVGQVSEPVRTRFGYHIIKVEDRRQSRGQIRVAHIMIRTSDRDAADKQEMAEKQIKDIYNELQIGGDFSDLALKFSDDAASSGKGGELPWFGAGKMVEEFENEAFKLQDNEEISKPFKSRYGWHVVKRIDFKPLESYDEMKSELKSKVTKDTRSELTRSSFIGKLKKEYNFKEYSKNLTPVYAVLDTNLFYGKWDVKKASKLNKPLFEIDGKVYGQQEFAQYLAANQGKTRKESNNMAVYGRDQYNRFVDETIYNLEDARLEAKYPEFKALMREYRDGILLFELTDQMVWSKAVKDTSGLQAFYDKNKSNYMYQERAAGEMYYCKDEAVAKKVRKLASKGKTTEQIRAAINTESNLDVRMLTVLFERNDMDFLKEIEWKTGVSKNFELNNQVCFFHIKELKPAEPKALYEVKGLVTAAYQNHLEAEWLKTLRSKYDYNVNKDVLYSIK
jgi:peptidyl-prolyl cis-trans isomerase SurA